MSVPLTFLKITLFLVLKEKQKFVPTICSIHLHHLKTFLKLKLIGEKLKDTKHFETVTYMMFIIYSDSLKDNEINKFKS